MFAYVDAVNFFHNFFYYNVATHLNKRHPSIFLIFNRKARNLQTTRKLVTYVPVLNHIDIYDIYCHIYVMTLKINR